MNRNGAWLSARLIVVIVRALTRRPARPPADLVGRPHGGADGGCQGPWGGRAGGS
jgi:hypothetical protein